MSKLKAHLATLQGIKPEIIVQYLRKFHQLRVIQDMVDDEIVDYLDTSHGIVTLDNASIDDLKGHTLWPKEGRDDDIPRSTFDEVQHLLHVDRKRSQELALEIVGEIVGERLV